LRKKDRFIGLLFLFFTSWRGGNFHSPPVKLYLAREGFQIAPDISTCFDRLYSWS
jgi:hypothetical protein